jgi:two-component system sensor histidine kinase DesK
MREQGPSGVTVSPLLNIARSSGLFGATAWPVFDVARNARSRRARARGIVILALFVVWPLWSTVRTAGERLTGPAGIVIILLAVAYGASWIIAMSRGVSRPPRDRILLICCVFALGFGLAALRGEPGELGNLAYALTAAVWLLPARWGLLVALVVEAVQVVAASATAGSVGWDAVLAVAPNIVTPVALVLLIRLIIQLSQAREEIATLATAAERARFARDLHDVLGHSLTTITVRTGLARRLLESGADREQVLAELRDIERLSRQAHAEIRATVSGHRRASLVEELVGARAALRAAGISCTLPSAVDHVPADLREPFAYTLREGITNVIRHSGATRCEVRLGESSLEIRDNGRSAEDVSHKTSANSAMSVTRPSGNGLAGLTERLRAVNGRIEAGPLPQGGFRLRASRT